MTGERFPHDAAYKRFFRNRDMVASLLRSFVPEPFIADLDFETLEPYPTAHVTDDFRERHNDSIWRVRWKDRDLYLLFLLEYQSDEDWWMAVRILAYTALLWQDLIKEGAIRRGDTLPPVFPLVLYNGNKAWRAPTDVAELLTATHASLAPYQPRQRYFLLDEGRVAEQKLAEGQGLATLLVRLERARDMQAILPILDDMLIQLQGETHLELRRLFAAWLSEIVLKRAGITENIPQFNDLREVRDMLAERVEQWKHDYIQQGVLLGEARGISIGEAKGVGRALLNFLHIRFGLLPDEVIASIEGISDSQKLLDLSQVAYSAESLHTVVEVLEHMGQPKQEV